MEAREKMPKVSNTVNNHGGRVHSLYTAPVFQRSPYASSEVTHPQGSEYSAARNLREQGQTTDLPRDRAKEGPGRRLLNVSGAPAGGVCPLRPPRPARDQWLNACSGEGGGPAYVGRW